MTQKKKNMPTLGERSAGILLHPTSLPSIHGIGDLGTESYRFVNFLRSAGQRWWQMLPVGPTGSANSPYQSPSAFAGNPLLISLEELAKNKLIDKNVCTRRFPVEGRDSFTQGQVRIFKEKYFREAFARLKSSRHTLLKKRLTAFKAANDSWLSDYALFAALEKKFRHASWAHWPSGIRNRKPVELNKARRELREETQYAEFLQFIFASQWNQLKAYCRSAGIGLIGDVPIFTAHQSADVWSRPELFLLNEAGRSTTVAGVPPDYFSRTGQRWGNPLFDWTAHRRENYAWWTSRIKNETARFDVIRLDHFIGFHRNWAIPARAKTAMKGKWIKGPGNKFFDYVLRHIPEHSIIAEDLGLVTPEVHALRDRFGFPGMRVLEFAFNGDTTNNNLPHNLPRNCVLYTGTHDNDTTAGWFKKISAIERAVVRQYLGDGGKEIHWDLIHLAYASVADTVIIPLQDVLGLGNKARMNRPGTKGGNWKWRFEKHLLTKEISSRLAAMVKAYGRSV